MNHVTLIENNDLLLDNITFHIYAGEILGLVAKEDKGADKLINLICNNSRIDFGSIWFDGRVVNRYSYSDNSYNKVYVIEKNSHLVEALSIADNIFVMRKGFRKYFINERVLEKQIERYLRENDIDIDLYKRVSDLNSIDRCKIELIKADISGCRLIIIDNPSNFLSQYELAELHELLEKFKEKGLSIIYIGYHHEEVFKIASRTALFARGQIKKIFEYNEMNDEAIKPYILSYLVDRVAIYDDNENSILHFHNVYTDILKGLDFVLYSGECVTLLDIDNNLPPQMKAILMGQEEIERGYITLNHQVYTKQMAMEYLKHGISIIPEDSTRNVLFPDRTYLENLAFLIDIKIKKSIISKSILRSVILEYREKIGDIIENKSIIGLELKDLLSLVYYRNHLFSPKLVLCIQPFAKGDLECRIHIINLIRELKKKGIAVLIISTNISDTKEVSDRMIIIEDGKKKAEYRKEDFDMISF